MGFTVDPTKIREETDPEEKAWLVLYRMIESYRARGMVLKASDVNLRFCQTMVNIAELEKKSPSQ